MSADRFYVPQDGHVVNILPPVDITGGKTSQCFHVKKHRHVSILVQIGVSAAAFTKILVNACTDNAGTGATAIAFDIFTQEATGAANDVLSARTPVTSAGYTPSAADGIFYVIELDAAQLPQGSPYLQLQLTNGANSVIASAVAILSGSRYASDQSDTVTA
jgi:hypothetical protein